MSPEEYYQRLDETEARAARARNRILLSGVLSLLTLAATFTTGVMLFDEMVD